MSLENRELVLQNSALQNALTFSEDDFAEFENDAGKGVSQRPEDNIIPTIRVLQANSPECSAQGQRFIMGAEPGAYLFKSAHPIVIKGDPGLVFVPSILDLKWLEFNPRARGGGFVGSHKDKPTDAVLREDDNGRKFWLRPSSKTEVAEFRFRYGFWIPDVDGMPVACAMSFTGTGHTDCRAWESLMNQLLTPGGAKCPAWAAAYRITSRGKTNAKGQWMGSDIQRERKTTPAERNLARAMYDAFIEGKARVDEAGEVDAEFTEVIPSRGFSEDPHQPAF
jgi:hypothetical protein